MVPTARKRAIAPDRRRLETLPRYRVVVLTAPVGQLYAPCFYRSAVLRARPSLGCNTALPLNAPDTRRPFDTCDRQPVAPLTFCAARSHMYPYLLAQGALQIAFHKTLSRSILCGDPNPKARAIASSLWPRAVQTVGDCRRGTAYIARRAKGNLFSPSGSGCHAYATRHRSSGEKCRCGDTTRAGAAGCHRACRR
jgi:hypothetical protein